MMATLTRLVLEYQLCFDCNTAFRLFRHPDAKQWSVSVYCNTFGSEDIEYFDFGDYEKAHARWKEVKKCPCIKEEAAA